MFTKYRVIATCAVVALVLSACGQSPTSKSISANKTSNTRLDAGQRLTLILGKNQPNADEVRERFFRQAFPISRDNGMKDVHFFSVTKTIMGEFKPEFFGLYAWPDSEATDRVRNNSEFIQSLKPLRPKIWSELTIVDVDLDAPLDIKIDEKKHYTIALGWYGDKDSYQRYFDGSVPLRKELGVKILFRLPISEFESITPIEGAEPDFAALVEWPDVDGPGRYFMSDTFKELQPFVQAGIKKIEWMELGKANY